MKRQALALLIATAVVELLAETYIDNAHACSDDPKMKASPCACRRNLLEDIVR